MASKSKGNFWKTVGAVIIGAAIVAGVVGGSVAISNAVKRNNCEHTYENGVCTNCGSECEHTYENGVCTICGVADSEADSGGLRVTTLNSKTMSLKAKALAAGVEGDIAEQSEESYNLVATITPADAVNQEVDWTVSFVDATSAWATGKDDEITFFEKFDYVKQIEVEFKK